MKQFRFPLLSLLMAIAVAFPMVAHAKKKEKAPKPYVPIHRVIKSVSATSITVGDPKRTLTYAINADTVVEIRGVRSKVSDLQVGMKVSVETGAAINIAERITADAAPSDPPPKKKK